MPGTITFTSASVEQTHALGAALAELLRAGDVVALVGELGAGKTQLVRGVASGLGVDPRLVSSPTFVLMCDYPTRDNAPPMIHLDAYRLEGLSDFESIGWGGHAAEQAISAIEWADRLEGHLPADHLRIELEHAGETQRRITLDPRGAWAKRIHQLEALIETLTATRPCPTCEKPVRGTEPTFPFCSKRCRMADLNRWFDERYRVSRPITADDELED